MENLNIRGMNLVELSFYESQEIVGGADLAYKIGYVVGYIAGALMETADKLIKGALSID